jgi:putative lipoic acid-binding regulatory protein
MFLYLLVIRLYQLSQQIKIFFSPARQRIVLFVLMLLIVIYIILFYNLCQALVQNILSSTAAEIHCDMSMENKGNMSKVQIHYPCQWLYKVIGFDQERLHRALLEIFSKDSCSISYSNSSGSGKYHCLNLEVTVKSEEERNSIYMILKANPQVKTVL